MANKIQKTIYSLSVLVPLCLTLAIAWYFQYQDWKIPMVLIVVGILMSTLLYKTFTYGKDNIEEIDIRITEISPRDGWIAGYMVAYAVPFASMVLDDFNMVLVGTILTGIILVLVFSNSVTPNMLLFLRGYHFYAIITDNGISECILISKRVIRNTKHLKRVKRIFEYLLLDIGRS